MGLNISRRWKFKLERSWKLKNWKDNLVELKGGLLILERSWKLENWKDNLVELEGGVLVSRKS